MDLKLDITASIVLYNENIKELTNTVNCFLDISLSKKLYLIDNTPNTIFKGIFNHKDIQYIAVGKNIGFGSGHNTVVNQINNLSQFHLILNPDVHFQKNVIPKLIAVLQEKLEVIMVAPKVLFPDGSHQYSCRRYPSVLELLARRFVVLKKLLKNTLFKGEYRDKDLDQPFFAEYITGCFQLYKTDSFVQLKGFDERYFLYMEDVDICKEIDALGKQKLYYPKEQITHVLKQGSSKNLKLFFRHTSSAIKYFLKWGFR